MNVYTDHKIWNTPSLCPYIFIFYLLERSFIHLFPIIVLQKEETRWSKKNFHLCILNQ
jgi:hypothetical protein